MTLFDQKFVSEDGAHLKLNAYLLLALLCLAFFMPGLVTLPPTDRDESSFAQASKQMVETGNYVDIRLQDKPRYKKPIGIYWLQAASVRLFNQQHLDEIWAYRLPSFAGATIAVLMTAALGALLFNPMTGFLAALMMVGCVILNTEARLAKTDAALLGSIMVMQYALARAYVHKVAHRLNSFVFWTALGIGLLIKGPIILLVLFSTLLWLRIKDKNIVWFEKLHPLIGFIYLLLLVLPWFIAIMTQSHGAFAQQSAGNDMLGKLWQGQNRGILPPGLHLIIFPIVFFPFALLTQLALPDTWKNRAQPHVAFCLGWIIPTWIVFELSLTKLPHYTLPTFPAIAILTAKALNDGYPELMQRSWRWLLALAVGLWLLVGMGFAVAFALLPYIADHTWNYAQLAASLLFIILQGASLFMLFQRKVESVYLLTIGSMVFIGTVFGANLPRLEHVWVSRQIVQIAEAIKPCPQLQIVSASYGEPSLVFMAGTKTKIVSEGTIAAAELQNNACAVAVVDDKHKQTFLDAFPADVTQPAAMGTAEGLSAGHGHHAVLTIYRMPSAPVVQ